jgi:hypothetical protein
MDSNQAAFRSFKTKLTRRKNAKDYEGIIQLWQEFESYPWSQGMPDDWRRWERAAEDAMSQLRRQVYRCDRLMGGM